MHRDVSFLCGALDCVPRMLQLLRAVVGQSRRKAIVRYGGRAVMATQRNDVMCQKETFRSPTRV